MTTICHLFDGAIDWEQRLDVSPLLVRVPQDRFTHRLGAMDPAAAPSIRSLGRRVDIVARCGGVVPLSAPGVLRWAQRCDADLMHAWGPRAAAAARAAGRCPIVLSVHDPQVARRDAAMIRTLAQEGSLAVACSTQIVRRRLVEGGVHPDLCVVIRPGVDFGRINRWRREPLREQLGVDSGDALVLLPPIDTSDDGPQCAYLALATMALAGDPVRVLVPGGSRQQQQVRRFARSLTTPTPLVAVPHTWPVEKALAACDALVVRPEETSPPPRSRGPWRRRPS